MYALLALIFLGLSVWRGFIDYTQTLGLGEAYRMAAIETVWAELSPGTYETLLPKLQATEVPILWDPVGLSLMAAPLAPVLFVIAVFFYAIRKKSY